MRIDGMMMEELDYRENDSLQVSLLWNRVDNSLTVRVVGAKADDAFELPVEPHEAIDAFRHPFAYAAYRGEMTQPAQRGVRLSRNARRPS